MALTNTLVSRSYPPPGLVGLSGQPNLGSIFTFDLTLGSAAVDYGANGIDLTAAAVLNMGGSVAAISQVAHIISADVRTSGNVLRNVVPKFDQANKTLRFYKTGEGVLSFVSTPAMGTGNGAGTETYIRTSPFSLPANTLSTNGMGVRVTWSGLSTATADATKTIKVRLGGVAGFDVTAGVTSIVLTTTVITHWSMTATIIRTGSATQDAWFNWTANTATGTTPQSLAGFTTGGTQDFTTNLTLGGTVNATNANVMIGKTELIELLNLPTTGGQLTEVFGSSDFANGDIVRITAICI